jgi:hypothetical protein
VQNPAAIPAGTRYNVLERRGANPKKGEAKMWKSGIIQGYKYEIKQYGEGSQFGINEGKISKLSIRDKDGKWVYNFDRGLDFDKLNETGKAVYAQILAEYN